MAYSSLSLIQLLLTSRYLEAIKIKYCASVPNDTVSQVRKGKFQMSKMKIECIALKWVGVVASFHIVCKIKAIVSLSILKSTQRLGSCQLESFILGSLYKTEICKRYYLFVCCLFTSTRKMQPQKTKDIFTRPCLWI